MEPFLEHHFVADKNQFAWLIFLFFSILLIGVSKKLPKSDKDDLNMMFLIP